MHQIFCSYYEALAAKQHSFPDENTRKTLLVSVARTVFDEMAQNSFLWDIKKEQLFGDQQNKGLLDLFIDHDNTNLTALTPVHFEKAFQGVVIDSKLDPDLVVKGVLDVVLEQGGMVGVMDYKTGKRLPTAADIRSFRSLQIPLYLLALRHLYPSKTVVGGLLFQVHDQERFGKSVLMMNPELGKTVFDLGRKRPFKMDDGFWVDYKQHLLALIRFYKKGYFGTQVHTPFEHMKTDRQRACSYCDYRFVCRYKERFS